MPTKRTVRTRNRRTGPLTGAELQWLTGQPQDGANKFELDELEDPWLPHHFVRCDAALDRAADIITGVRLRELRAFVAERRKEFCARRPLRLVTKRIDDDDED